MKRILILLLSSIIICGSLIAQTLPTFDNKEAFVFNASIITGKASDNVKVVNQSDEENISFFVYAYNEKTMSWDDYGRASLKEFYDGDTIDSPLEGQIKKIKYFAILPESGNQYKYEFEKRNNDLYIHVFSMDETISDVIKQKAYIVDTSTISGKFKDNIKFINLTKDMNISFMVYAFNREGEEWQKVGVAILKNFNDKDTIDSPLEKTLKNFKYFAIVSRNDKEYKYDVQKISNDLIVNVK